jgi:hypothetical protein
MLPLQPGWHDNDLFKMNQIERAKIQEHVARKLGLPLKHSGSEVTAALGVHWAYEVSGVQPYTPTAAEKMVGNYKGNLDKKPVRGSKDSEADNKNKLMTWQQDVDTLCSWSTVLNADQTSWECPNGPWNVGYIELLRSKLENGEMKWDKTIERKAGGINIHDTIDFANLKLTVANSASLMSLISLVVGHVEHVLKPSSTTTCQYV